jgi:hypothetical protein
MKRSSAMLLTATTAFVVTMGSLMIMGVFLPDSTNRIVGPFVGIAAGMLSPIMHRALMRKDRQ